MRGVVYVDSDPVAVVHSRNILDGDNRTSVVQADMRDPGAVLESPGVRSLLDLDQPIAVMMVAVLHFVPDSDDPAKIVASYRDAAAPGSFMVMSHASQDGQPEKADSHQDLYLRTATPMSMRSRSDVTSLFDGFDLIDPGVVFLPLWRPESLDDIEENPERFSGLAAVGRKPLSD